MNPQEQHKVNINHVRQVLMHELGLSRDEIRAMIKGIVTEAVEKFIDAGSLEQHLTAEIARQLKPKNLQVTIRDMVADAVVKSVRSEVLKNLTFEISGKLG